MKTKSTIQTLLFILKSHKRINKHCPDIVDIIENFIEIEKAHISSAWNDGYWLGKNGQVAEKYKDGKEYFEEVYIQYDAD